MAFRLELADFGAFYERTYGTAFRTRWDRPRSGPRRGRHPGAYVAAYKHRDRFRGEAPSTAWLHRIVVNQALAALRRRRATSPGCVHLVVMAARLQRGSASHRLSLLQALDELPPQQRAAVILRYYHDYDYATIAQILGTTSTNVGAMLLEPSTDSRLPWIPIQATLATDGGAEQCTPRALNARFASALRETLDPELGPDPRWTELTCRTTRGRARPAPRRWPLRAAGGRRPDHRGWWLWRCWLVR